MSWNGYPTRVRNFSINKLKCKCNSSFSISSQKSFLDDNLLKVSLRTPYLGKRGESLAKSCVSKLHRYLKNPIRFITIYNTKNVSYFTSTKDKILELSRSNVYQVTCPGCQKSCLGKTDRCLEKRLAEHATRHNNSAVSQHFLQCEHAQFLADLHNQYDRLYDLSFSSNLFSSIFIFNNYKILLF